MRATALLTHLSRTRAQGLNIRDGFTFLWREYTTTARKMRPNGNVSRMGLGDFKLFLPQMFRAESKRCFHQNSDSRIAVGEMQFLQNFRALADKVGNQRVRIGTVHVADALKIQNDFFVAVDKRINTGESKGSRFFTICQKISRLVRQLDVQRHEKKLPNSLPLGNKPTAVFTWCIISGKFLIFDRTKVKTQIVP